MRMLIFKSLYWSRDVWLRDGDSDGFTRVAFLLIQRRGNRKEGRRELHFKHQHRVWSILNVLILWSEYGAKRGEQRRRRERRGSVTCTGLTLLVMWTERRVRQDGKQGRLFSCIAETNLVHHFQVFKSPGIAQKWLRVAVCSRLMYSVLTPAFI